MSQSREQLLQLHAALPESYQPAWGLPESNALARRSCQDRFAVLLSALEAFPRQGTLRILDIGCAQGYFSVGLECELGRRGRAVEVVAVDSLAENVHFCAALAAHHGAHARFIHDRFDAGFLKRHALADFDVVLALNVLHHILELEGAAAAETALAAIRAHSTALFCELAQREEQLDWVSEWHASDDALLSGYAFRRCLGSFATHLSEVPRPLYACSNRFAYVGGRWFAFERVLDRAHPGVSEGFAGQRRFFIGRNNVVKSCRAVGDFGAFNRAELAAEAEVLTVLGDEPSRYPPLLAQADDGDEVWLARGALPGALVSELIEAGAGFDRELLVRALLGELAHLHERGFHHADLRAWNMLWHEGDLRLIDFGSMTRAGSPLHRIALAAVLAEIALGKLSNEQPWYQLLHPLDSYPAEWLPLIRYLLGCEQQQFSLAGALEIFNRGNAISNMTTNAMLAVDPGVLAASAQAQIDGFARLHEYAQSLESGVEVQVAEVTKERQASRTALEDAAKYAQSLRDQIDNQAAEATRERELAQAAIANAADYGQSLQNQIEEQTAEAVKERASAQTALAEAADYAHSLEAEREGLKAELRRLRSEFDQLRKRFRFLKPLWPHNSEHQA